MVTKTPHLGLLKAAFIPSEDIAEVRTYHRHCASIMAQGAASIQKMQKALRLMNIRLDIAISDITGLSGMRILEAIVSGQRDGKLLASLVHGCIKKSKEEIEASLQGTWKAEQLFILADELDAYKTCQKRMLVCDERIEVLLSKITKQLETPLVSDKTKTKKRRQKNGVNYDVQKLSMAYFGVDLLSI